MCICGHSLENHRNYKEVQVTDPLSLTKDTMLKISLYLSHCKFKDCKCRSYENEDPT